MQYGYVQMSMQSINNQSIDALLSCGILKQNILVDCIADKCSDRPAFQQLISKLKPGDTIIVCSLSQLGADLSAIAKTWIQITQEKKGKICVLDMENIFLISQDEMNRVMEDTFPQLLLYLFKTESHYRKQRQAEGIAQSLAQGKKFGPRPMEKPAEYQALYEAWKHKAVTGREAAKRLHISATTFAKWAKNDMAMEGHRQQT